MWIAQLRPGPKRQGLGQLQNLHEDLSGALGINRWPTSTELQLEPTCRSEPSKGIRARLAFSLQISIDHRARQSRSPCELGLAETALALDLLEYGDSGAI
jgi:hypothetical protein